uniref:AAA domain-containing protein n=2 Tax=Macrostomum lignano TaxID=282301 RepID=A0A1I8GQ47_9PLAT
AQSNMSTVASAANSLIEVDIDKQINLINLNAATHELATGTVLYYTVTEVSSGSEHLAGPILAGLEFTSLRVQAANNNYKSAVVSYAPRLYPSPSLPLAAGFVNRLTTLLRRCVDASIENSLPPVTVLLHGPSGCGKAAAALAVADRLSLHVRIARCENLTVQLPGSVSSSDGSALGSASDYGEEDFSTILSGDAALPRLLLLTDVGLLARKRDGLSGADPAAVTALARLLNQTGRQQQDGQGRQPSVIIGTCQSLSQLDAGLLALFQLDLAVPPPTESERRQALLNAGAGLESDAALLDRLTQRSVGFNAAELWALRRRARLSEFGYQDSAEETIDLTATRSKLTTNIEGQIRPSALSAALDATLKARAASLGASSLPTTAAVAWEDVGGQEAAVAEILATVEAPLKRPELRRHRRCGLLLYGPPGVGKTLLARAAASQLGLSFLSVKGPELVNMYVGQSEANVRALFADAIRLAPCVVFFDELDSIAPARGGGGGSGAVDRIVSQLLAELDGIRTADAAVFVIGATNRADLLDRALLRPGRFDQALLIAPAESLEDKTALFRAQLRRRTCAPDVDVETLAAALPSLVTGADVMSVVSNAADLALREAVSAIDSGSEDELSVNCCLTQAMLLSCAKELAPSVTAEQMLVYRSMQV